MKECKTVTKSLLAGWVITLLEGIAEGDWEGLSYYSYILVRKQSWCPFWLQKELVQSQGHGLLWAWAGLVSSVDDQACRAEAGSWSDK